MSAPHPTSSPDAARPCHHRHEQWTLNGQFHQDCLPRTVSQ